MLVPSRVGVRGAAAQRRINLKGVKGLCLRNDSSQGHDLALTLVLVPKSDVKGGLDYNLSGHEFHHTNSLTLLVKNMLYGKLHCQKSVDSISFQYQIARQQLASNVNRDQEQGFSFWRFRTRDGLYVSGMDLGGQRRGFASNIAEDETQEVLQGYHAQKKQPAP